MSPEASTPEAAALIEELRQRCELSERALAEQREAGGESAKLVRAWRECSELRALLDARPDARLRDRLEEAERARRQACAESDELRERQRELRSALAEIEGGVEAWRAAAAGEIDELNGCLARMRAERDRLRRGAETAAFASAMLREAKRRERRLRAGADSGQPAAEPVAAEQAISRRERTRRAALRAARADRARLEREITELMARIDQLAGQLEDSEDKRDGERAAAAAERRRLEQELTRRQAIEQDLRALLESERAQAVEARRIAASLRRRLTQLPALGTDEQDADEWSALDHELVERAKTLALAAG